MKCLAGERLVLAVGAQTGLEAARRAARRVEDAGKRMDGEGQKELGLLGADCGTERWRERCACGEGLRDRETYLTLRRSMIMELGQCNRV